MVLVLLVQLKFNIMKENKGNNLVFTILVAFIGLITIAMATANTLVELKVI